MYQGRWADIRIFGEDVERVRVLLFNGDEAQALIGRNVLERFAVVFDGPAKQWYVIESRQQITSAGRSLGKRREKRAVARRNAAGPRGRPTLCSGLT